MKRLLEILGVVLVIVAVIFIQRKYFPTVEMQSTTDTVYTTHTDTITIVKLVPYKESLPPDTIFIPADTSELLAMYRTLHQDFYTKRYYSQNYKVDSIGTATVKGRVFMNRLDSLQFNYNLRPATVINNTIISPSYNSIFVGVDYNKGIIRNISFNQKNRYIYKVGYNLSSSSIELGVSVNINKLFKK